MLKTPARNTLFYGDTLPSCASAPSVFKTAKREKIESQSELDL